jgi:hypothetical protein
LSLVQLLRDGPALANDQRLVRDHTLDFRLIRRIDQRGRS